MSRYGTCNLEKKTITMYSIVHMQVLFNLNVKKYTKYQLKVSHLFARFLKVSILFKHLMQIHDKAKTLLPILYTTAQWTIIYKNVKFGSYPLEKNPKKNVD